MSFTPTCYLLLMTEPATLDGRLRRNVRPGLDVSVVLKADQRTGRLTRGTVADLLTSSPNHPHGIKVRLTNGLVGRVKVIHGSDASPQDRM